MVVCLLAAKVHIFLHIISVISGILQGIAEIKVYGI